MAGAVVDFCLREMGECVFFCFVLNQCIAECVFVCCFLKGGGGGMNMKEAKCTV